MDPEVAIARGAGFATGLVVASLIAACPDGNITTSDPPPEASIVAPADGATALSTEVLLLQGVVSDGAEPPEGLRVVWTSTIDGVLWDGPDADTAGNVSFAWNQPSPGDHEVTLSVIDAAGQSGRDTIAVHVPPNAPPVCVFFAPADGAVLDASQPVIFAGSVTDDLSSPLAMTTNLSSDVDGSYGAPQADVNGVMSMVIGPSPGDHLLTLTVTDLDGLSCVVTHAVHVDEPPSAPAIALLPDPPNIAQALRAAIVVPSVDPEGGEVAYTYSWAKDGVFQQGLSTDEVPASELAAGQLWTATVRATDAAGLSSGNVQQSVTIGNSSPLAPTVAVTPASPTQAHDLICAVTVDSVDPDGDSVSYGFAWEVDGVPSGDVGAVLPFTATAPGETWTCVVTPNDGEDDGATGEFSVVVTEGCASLSVDAAAPGAVTVGDAAALRLSASDFTVEAWALRDGAGAMTIAGKRGSAATDGWLFGIDGSGHPAFYVGGPGGASVIGTATVVDGTWRHVAASFDAGSGTLSLFVSGQPAGSGTLPQPPGTTTAALLIGDDPQGAYGRFSGLLDDIRLSSVARYGSAFLPDAALLPDASTLAFWGFEEGAGTTTVDLSGNGHDGVLSGIAGFDPVSTCGIDQAPTPPTVAVTPAFPLDGDALSCAIVLPAVDPEGAALTYAGEWWVDGAPSGNAFSGSAGTLSAANTALGEQWTCRIWANDGSQDGDPGSASVFVGTMPVGALAIPNPAVDVGTTISFAPPVAGLLRFTFSNPDASRDGVVRITPLGYGDFWLFSGLRDWAYDGAVQLGMSTRTLEIPVSPAMGTLTIDLDYLTAAGQNTGPDSVDVELVYQAALSTASATLILDLTTTPQGTTPQSVAATVPAGQRLLVERVACGFGGGAFGVYRDADGATGNDGVIRVDSGFASNCAIALHSVTVGSGSFTFTAVNEDDYFADNTDTRRIRLYRYTP